MSHPSLEDWEKNLKRILDELDDLLENQYGTRYHLHPARASRGKTSNKAHDGLFDITALFTLGVGSEHGEGYVIDIHMVTLEQVPEKIRNEIETITLKRLRESLPNYFPGKNLKVNKDGNVIKLYGDLRLGLL